MSVLSKVRDVVRTMERIAPSRLSEPWDNTGLLLGDWDREVRRLMTCLTLTSDSVGEAIDGKVDLVVAHHPLPFKPLNRITTDSPVGQLLWRLAGAGVSVYTPHTAWDSAAQGINWQLATRIGLQSIESLVPLSRAEPNDVGAGRCGTLSNPMDLRLFAVVVARAIPNCRLRVVDCGSPIYKVAVACGSGGSFVQAALSSGCDLLVTGEATFHQCLEAEALHVSLLMIGHFASEKFAMDHLAEVLAAELPSVEVWSSKLERDPVQGIALG